MSAKHTFVISDIHLSEAEPPHPGNPLWKRYKRPKYFVDKSLKRMLEHIQTQVPETKELILNGDIFDFDSVLTIPEKPTFHVSWLEKKRGLASEEEKSRCKLQIILHDHPIFVEALRDFILKGNHVIFVIGNHDMELHWSSAQEDLLNTLNLPQELKSNVRICEWFYVSGSDTLIEHGNQYDDYCLCQNPINPLIKKASKLYVRLPFGNLAGRFILNGIGLLNPHVDSSFIKTSFLEYIKFFLKYFVRTQPLLLWTWFWSAVVTLVNSLVEGFEPALVDPLTVERRVRDIAKKANATPRIVRSLRSLHVHPAVYNPYKILKELWLDRAFLLFVLFLIAFNIFSLLLLFSNFSIWWFWLIFFLVLPFFVFYSRSIESELAKVNKIILSKAPLSAQIAKVNRVIMGHTHFEMHSMIGNVEVLNTGTWSPAYEDIECTKPFGKKVFAWIRPVMGREEDGGSAPNLSRRIAELHEWLDPGTQLIPASSSGQ